MSVALVALGIGATADIALPQPASPPPEEEEYGEFLARPEELGSVAVNDIVKSIRLNASAMQQGKRVYEKHCAACHGADLGRPECHARSHLTRNGSSIPTTWSADQPNCLR
jgi:mono/diheme cytochrome c family protein